MAPSRRFRRRCEQTPHQRQRGFGGRIGDITGTASTQQINRIVRKNDDMGGVLGVHQRHQAFGGGIGRRKSPWRVGAAQHPAAPTAGSAAAADRRRRVRSRGSAARSRTSGGVRVPRSMSARVRSGGRRDGIQNPRHLRLEQGTQRVGHQADRQHTGDRNRGEAHDLRGVDIGRRRPQQRRAMRNSEAVAPSSKSP